MNDNPYRVKPSIDGDYVIVRQETRPYDVTVGRASTVENANKIAQALNEAEGL